MGLFAGFNAIHAAVYRSPAQVFQEFMNGPDRLLFPVVVALVGGAHLAAEISQRFTANTRTREGLRGNSWVPPFEFSLGTRW